MMCLRVVIRYLQEPPIPRVQPLLPIQHISPWVRTKMSRSRLQELEADWLDNTLAIPILLTNNQTKSMPLWILIGVTPQHKIFRFVGRDKLSRCIPRLILFIRKATTER